MKRKGILLIVIITAMIGLSFSGNALEGFWDSVIIEDSELIAGVWEDIEGEAIGNQIIDKNGETNETCDNGNNSVDNSSMAGQINQTEINETISDENINNKTHNIWDEVNETISPNETNVIDNQTVDNETICNETISFIEDETQKLDNETSDVLINETIGGEK